MSWHVPHLASVPPRWAHKHPRQGDTFYLPDRQAHQEWMPYSGLPTAPLHAMQQEQTGPGTHAAIADRHGR